MGVTSRDRIAGTRTALRILEQIWECTDAEAAEILDMTPAEIRAWRAAPASEPITDDRLIRVSYILGIHKALDTLVPKRSAHAGFMRRENPALEGVSPLDVMREGTAGLRRIRRWLDGECQW